MTEITRVSSTFIAWEAIKYIEEVTRLWEPRVTFGVWSPFPDKIYIMAIQPLRPSDVIRVEELVSDFTRIVKSR